MSWPETVRKTDLDITWFSGTGGGGQYRNKHPNCCRMVHKPTGIRVTGQSHRERPANQREAWNSLTRKLVPLMKAAASMNSDPPILEKIRSYHFPDRRVTDKRCPSKRFDPVKILEGDLDDLIKSVKAGA